MLFAPSCGDVSCRGVSGHAGDRHGERLAELLALVTLDKELSSSVSEKQYRIAIMTPRRRMA